MRIPRVNIVRRWKNRGVAFAKDIARRTKRDPLMVLVLYLSLESFTDFKDILGKMWEHGIIITVVRIKVLEKF